MTDPNADYVDLHLVSRAVFTIRQIRQSAYEDKGAYEGQTWVKRSLQNTK